MAASNLTRHYGNHDLNLGELRYARIHIYDTVINADADSGNANGRFCFIEETNRFYMGRSNVWIQIESIGQVSTPSNLPIDETEGAVYVVTSDPSVDGGANIYVLSSGVWISLRDNGVPSVIQTKTASGTLVASKKLFVFVNSTTAEFTLVLPATASAGDQITLKDIWGTLNTKPVFLDPGTQTLDGLSALFEMNRAYQCVVIQYVSGHWVVVSDA